MNPEDPKYDRLKLTEARLQDIAEGLRQVAGLPSPLGRTLKRRTLPNGLRIRRVSVPFGVIGIIYEARPNVSFDVFALCIKAGSACVLKGGSDAEYSNLAIVGLIRQVLEQCGMDRHLVELLPVGHEAADCLLHARGLVDLIIPRGGRGLIDFVRQNATVPVIETGAGVCHAYFDCYADLEKGKAIVLNAKTRRVSVCNALDCLIVDVARLADLPALCAPLQDKHVMIYADAASYNALKGAYPDALLQEAGADAYGKEFLDYKTAIPRANPIQLTVDTKTLIASIDRVSVVISDKQKSPVRCVFGLDKVSLSAKTANGEARDVCKIAGDGKDLEIGFNNRYLLEALKYCPADSVRMELNTGISPCIIVPLEGEENFLYMVLPVRLKNS